MAKAHVTFSIKQRVAFGQEIVVCGSPQQLGNWNAHKSLKLKHHPDDEWKAEVDLHPGQTIEYKYIITYTSHNGKECHWETGPNRSLELPAAATTIEVHDQFKQGPALADFLLASSAFQSVIFGRPAAQQLSALSHGEEGTVVVRFAVNAWRVHPKDKLAIVGEIPQLGSWNVANAVPLLDGKYPTWVGEVRVHPHQFPFSYKYVVLRNGFGPVWDSSENRTAALSGRNQQILKIEDYPFLYNHATNFDWRGSGVAIPVFSLRSKNSLGVGEFLDIKPLVDLVKACSMQMIQVLPINDTSVTGTWVDSYPYSCVSVIALHPIYVNVSALASDMPELLPEIEKAKADLNKLDLDYEGVMSAKLRFLNTIFEAKKNALLQSADFKTFLTENAVWLQPYTLFCCLRDEFSTCDHFHWPKYSKITAAEIKELTAPASPYYNKALFWAFIQYHLSNQLSEATRYAATQGVAIKGDLPIGVDMNSVETWTAPHLFNLNTSTGAPPDYFSENGQNWGFPTYNWNAMQSDGYAWWQERLRQLDKYFHAMRIDHVLGFFRIWEIPAHGVTGMMGHFNPSIPIWRSELETYGIWDINRLTEPVVHWDILQSRFGSETKRVADKFFYEIGNGLFKFRPEYRTEKQIEAATNAKDSATADLHHLQKHLFSLLSNVCLFAADAAEGDNDAGNKFYPRFELFKTPMYQSLPHDWKDALYKLHNSYFYERQEDLWRSVGAARLEAFQRFSKMLICAEDLGLVPACVPPVLSDLGILGLRIQRMPKDTTKEFDTPWDYPYLTVCTPSCHDTSTTRAWWEEDLERSARYYHSILGFSDDAPAHCEAYVARKVVEDHLKSDSMWAIFPIQELFAMVPDLRREPPTDEQINNPANRYHYWKYRMHVSIEELIANNNFTDTVSGCVFESGRNTFY